MIKTSNYTSTGIAIAMVMTTAMAMTMHVAVITTMTSKLTIILSVAVLLPLLLIFLLLRLLLQQQQLLIHIRPLGFVQTLLCNFLVDQSGCRRLPVLRYSLHRTADPKSLGAKEGRYSTLKDVENQLRLCCLPVVQNWP